VSFAGMVQLAQRQHRRRCSWGKARAGMQPLAVVGVVQRCMGQLTVRYTTLFPRSPFASAEGRIDSKVQRVSGRSDEVYKFAPSKRRQSANALQHSSRPHHLHAYIKPRKRHGRQGKAKGGFASSSAPCTTQNAHAVWLLAITIVFYWSIECNCDAAASSAARQFFGPALATTLTGAASSCRCFCNL
jgi:hypothetical protein